MKIYQRERPVFIKTDDSRQSPERISDMLLRWTSDDIVDTIPMTLNKGETALYSVIPGNNEQYTLTFIGRHPIHDIYYRKAFIGDTLSSGYLKYTVVGPYTYIVDAETTPSSGLIYYVEHPADGITIIQSTDGCYLLINDSVIDWGVGRLIEPFNVIFDSYSATSTVTLIADNGSYDLGSETLTNTPVIDGLPAKIGYAFQLTDNMLSLRKTTAETGDVTDPGILSINGITPVDGNINIKVRV